MQTIYEGISRSTGNGREKLSISKEVENLDKKGIENFHLKCR